MIDFVLCDPIDHDSICDTLRGLVAELRIQSGLVALESAAETAPMAGLEWRIGLNCANKTTQ